MPLSQIQQPHAAQAVVDFREAKRELVAVSSIVGHGAARVPKRESFRHPYRHYTRSANK
jgi:hypothetical protein